jgi:hypothetical protein
MSYIAQRVLELAHLDKQNRVFIHRLGGSVQRDGYNATMLRVLALRIIANDY